MTCGIGRIRHRSAFQCDGKCRHKFTGSARRVHDAIRRNHPPATCEAGHVAGW